MSFDILRAGELPAESEKRIHELERRVEKLAKINASLMQRVERSMEQQANAFSLFQTAIGLESQVRIRTDELKTALERLERANVELLSARDAAELANRFKTRFFTAVGHDLLQPLHAARLSLSALTHIEQDREQSRLTEQVDHALVSVEELLRTILDLSKLDSGVWVPDVRPVALDDVLSAVVRDLAPIARAKGLEISARPTTAAVLSDPIMLRRIVQNLVANAVHYTHSGKVRLLCRRRGPDIRIEVWDTGPGIAAAEQKRIFAEFERGSASGTARVGGFGLGLAIVERMSAALEHHVSLCSKAGQGTCFAVSAVATEAPAPQPQIAPYGVAHGVPSARVLVIDNEPAVLDGMRALLMRWDCDVRLTSGRAEVERLFIDEPDFNPQIVLADYHLDGGENGVELVEVIVARLGGSTPAILITADQSLNTSPGKVGHLSVLKKPVKPAELRALMLHLLDSQC